MFQARLVSPAFTRLHLTPFLLLTSSLHRFSRSPTDRRTVSDTSSWRLFRVVEIELILRDPSPKVLLLGRCHGRREQSEQRVGRRRRKKKRFGFGGFRCRHHEGGNGQGNLSID